MLIDGGSSDDPPQDAAPPAWASVTHLRTEPLWTYRWPGGGAEDFAPVDRYRVHARAGRQEFLLGWTVRDAWGRARRRAIVFVQIGRSQYPLTEFVETDTGEYAALIPDPARRRAVLSNASRAPAHVMRSPERARRTDDVFEPVRLAPSLRYVVNGGMSMRCSNMATGWACSGARF